MSTYPYRAGIALDQMLNVLLLGGQPDMTISEHAAKSQRAGRVWACALCRWLSWTVERDHCGKQWRGVSITRLGALKAGGQLLALVGAFWLCSLALARWF